MPTYNARIRMVDDGGRLTSLGVQVAGTDADDAKTNLESFVADLKNVTKLGVLSGSLTVDASFTASAPQDGANTDVGGKVRGVSAVDSKIVIARVPHPIDDCINSTYGLILDDVALEAYLDNFLTAGKIRISDGEDVSSWIAGALDAR